MEDAQWTLYTPRLYNIGTDYCHILGEVVQNRIDGKCYDQGHRKTNISKIPRSPMENDKLAYTENKWTLYAPRKTLII